MNFASMLAKAKPVEVPIRFVYTGVIRVWMLKNPANKFERYEHFLVTLPDFDKLTESNIIDSVSNKVVKEVLKQSQCFSVIDLSFITNFKTKQHYNWFYYDTCFSSVKSKAKFEIKVELCKVPHENESVALDKSRGSFHTFYSYLDTLSKELRRKYELKVDSVWGKIL